MAYWRPKRRRQVNAGLVTGAADIDADSTIGATGTLVPALGAGLRVGMMGADGFVGFGPSEQLGVNPYRVLQWSPHAEGLSNLKPALDRAQQFDILLIIMVAGSSTNYGGGSNPTSGGPAKTYDAAAFQNQLDKLANAPNGQGVRISQLLQTRNALAYFGDEPNAATWDLGGGNTGYNAVQWNASARAVKDKWPGCLTFGRLTPLFHRDGWYGGFHIPTPGGYDAIDYGWLQYNAAYRKNGVGMAQALSDEVAIGLTLNMGIGFSLNLVNAGYRTNIAGGGANACWDYLNNGSSSGLVTGAGGSGGPVNDGVRVQCANINLAVESVDTPSGQTTAGGVSANRNLITGPDQIRAAAQFAAARADIPFMTMWTIPGPGEPSEADVLFTPIDYFSRQDFVDGRTDAMTIGAGRTTFNGYRTPKSRPVGGWPAQS